EELLLDENKGFESADTVTPNMILFTSYRAYDSYTWFVGTDTTARRENPMRIIFGRAHIGKFLVTLIGKRKPQPDCIIGDDGIDTFHKYVVVVPKDSSRIHGSYHRFHTDNPADTFTIHTKKLPQESTHRGEPGLYNLP